ncbi:hypothetical protein BJX68DRAFT_272135 [Aspergillus pseudodeflectus]
MRALTSIFFALSLLAIPSFVRAECRLHNAIEEDEKTQEDREALCLGQGEDSWTFSLQISMVSVPTFDGDNPFEGVAGHQAFIIYDNTCMRRGVYSPDNEGNDCGINYVIEEDWLPYTIVVTHVNWDVGDPYFYFNYANGAYMIGENGATCTDISSGLRAEQGCKSAFPINGEPE